MNKLSILLSILLLSGFQLAGQEVAAPESSPMDQLRFMIGEWEGEGWMMTRQGKVYSSTNETVECRLGCEIFVVEGLGVKIDSVTQEEKVVHNAFGVISYDAASQGYVMRAYKDGAYTESAVELLEEKVIRWSMEVPNGGQVRFTVDYSDGRWVETGEFSRDGGENWLTFLGMDLEQVEP